MRAQRQLPALTVPIRYDTRWWLWTILNTSIIAHLSWHSSGAVVKIESVHRRPARYTLNRYHRTSSVNDMIAELKWQTLADRRRVARLLMFYKIHYHLVTIEPLTCLCLQISTFSLHIPSTLLACIKLGPHLTQYGLGRGLPAHQMASWSTMHQRHRQRGQDRTDNGPIA